MDFDRPGIHSSHVWCEFAKWCLDFLKPLIRGCVTEFDFLGDMYDSLRCFDDFRAALKLEAEILADEFDDLAYQIQCKVLSKEIVDWAMKVSKQQEKEEDDFIWSALENGDIDNMADFARERMQWKDEFTFPDVYAQVA